MAWETGARARPCQLDRTRDRQYSFSPPAKARWESGYPEDCKSLHAGSIPARASKRPSGGAMRRLTAYTILVPYLNRMRRRPSTGNRRRRRLPVYAMRSGMRLSDANPTWPESGCTSRSRLPRRKRQRSQLRRPDLIGVPTGSVSFHCILYRSYLALPYSRLVPKGSGNRLRQLCPSDGWFAAISGRAGLS